MVTLAGTVPTPRAMPERPITVPRDPKSLDLPENLETVLAIAWASIEKDVIVPLLNAKDLTEALAQRMDTYRRWYHVATDALVSVLGEQRAMILAEDAENIMRSLNIEYGEKLLNPIATKAVAAGLALRQVIRQSVSDLLAKPELWDAASAELAKVVPAAEAHGLCLAAVLHYFQNPLDGDKSNAITLATWGYYYADMAYAELGFSQIELGMVSKLTRD